jgi:hypothetical protein
MGFEDVKKADQASLEESRQENYRKANQEAFKKTQEGEVTFTNGVIEEDAHAMNAEFDRTKAESAKKDEKDLAELREKIKGGDKEAGAKDEQKQTTKSQAELRTEYYALQNQMDQERLEKLSKELNEAANEFEGKFGNFLRSHNIYPDLSMALNCLEQLDGQIKTAKKLGFAPIFSSDRKKLKTMYEDESYLKLKDIYGRIKKDEDEKKRRNEGIMREAY